MSEVQTFLIEITECHSVPKWIKIKAELILQDRSIAKKSFLTGEEMLQISKDYFGIQDSFFIKKDRRRQVVETKHLIRYGLYLNGVSFDDIGKLLNCDRTTCYNSIKYIRDVTSVEEDFRNEVDNFLNYLEVKKIK